MLNYLSNIRGSVHLSVVKEPSVIIMLDGIAIMELVGLFDKDFETMTGEIIEDSDLNTGFAFLEEFFSQHETEGRFMLVSNLFISTLSKAVWSGFNNV